VLGAVEDVTLVEIGVLFIIVVTYSVIGLLDQLFQAAGDGVRPLTPGSRAEGLLESLDLQESVSLTQSFVVVVSHQAQRELLVLDQHLEAGAFLGLSLFESSSVGVQLLLVYHSNVSKPFPIRVDFTSLRVGGRLGSFLLVRLAPVHVDPVDGGLGSELRALLPARGIGTVGVG
jgi:hypothetical protein